MVMATVQPHKTESAATRRAFAVASAIDDLNTVASSPNTWAVLHVMRRAQDTIRTAAHDLDVASIEPMQTASLINALKLAFNNLHHTLSGNLQPCELGIGMRGPAGLILHWGKTPAERSAQNDYIADVGIFADYLDGILANLLLISGIWDRRGDNVLQDFQDITDAVLGSTSPQVLH
jgi:hypothetical protein